MMTYYEAVNYWMEHLALEPSWGDAEQDSVQQEAVNALEALLEDLTNLHAGDLSPDAFRTKL